MSERRDYDPEGFLERWSRLKKTPEPEQPQPPTTTGPAQAAEPPVLPRIEELTQDSDFRGFLHPKVDAKLRHAAMRKLFSDPHFNVMDGLDVYIDDYSKSDPIPPEMLAGLKQAQKILRWSEGKEDEPEENPEALPDAPQEVAALAPADDATAAGQSAGPMAEPVPVSDPLPDPKP